MPVEPWLRLHKTLEFCYCDTENSDGVIKVMKFSEFQVDLEPRKSVELEVSIVMNGVMIAFGLVRVYKWFECCHHFSYCSCFPINSVIYYERRTTGKHIENSKKVTGRSSGKTNRLGKLNSNGTPSKSKTLKLSHGYHCVFIPFEIDESIAATGLEGNFVELTKLRKKPG